MRRELITATDKDLARSVVRLFEEREGNWNAERYALEEAGIE